MSVLVFVVNLASSSDRWAFMKNRAAEIGLHLHRIEAVDGRKIPSEDWTDIDRAAFERNTGRRILPGEYGCYRSHILALQAFIDSSAAYGVILEDDVVPDADMMARTQAIIDTFPGLDMVKLVNHRAVGFIRLDATWRADRIGRTLAGPQGSAAAYLVSRKGAKQLVEALNKMSWPWDVALETYWETGINGLTVEKNILEFSQLRSQSSIAPDGYNDRFPVLQRIPTAYVRAIGHGHRFHHAALGPAGMIQKAYHPVTERPVNRLMMALAGLAVLLMLSVLWTESDAYRFAGIGLLISGLWVYFTRDLWRYDKPLIGLAGIACIGWASYVALRFGYTVLVHPQAGTGSAEGIYLFPLFYSTVGFAIWLFCLRPFQLVLAFMLGSLCFLGIFTDYSGIASDMAITLAHNNTIHASVASGMILICAVAFSVHIVNTAGRKAAEKGLLVALGAGVILLALINIMTLNSKGVWLAMTIAMPTLLSGLFLGRTGRTGPRIAAIIFVLLLGGVVATLFSDRLITVAGPTVTAGQSLLKDIAAGTGIIGSMENAIASPDIPTSVRERLELWLAALTIWSSSPILGAGVGWLSEWEKLAQAGQLKYNLLHNGFLELGVRYGILGLMFYGSLFGWAVRKVFFAARHALIAPEAAHCYLAVLVFFLVTNLTNSNIRLAIGESSMWLLVSFAFYCSYRLQEKGIERPRTWF
tara:strand:+ start:12039 stop:14138 length:2100 start_codon:yes stop_codon:yes gene_type:complete